MVTCEAYNHFNTKKFKRIYPDELEQEHDELTSKIYHTILMAEYSYKCMGGLSRKDYARVRYTHERLNDKLNMLYNQVTVSQDEFMQRGWRKLQISKGLYPYGISVEDAIKEYPEIKNYYQTGVYKIGGFVDKHIAHINHI